MAQQLKKKFIKDGAVDGSKIKLLKDQSIKGQDQNGQEVDLIKLDSSDKVLLKGQEAAFKSQIDSVQSAIQSEASSRASGDAQTLVDAKAYADQKMTDLMGGVTPATLDTIKEIAEAIQSDETAIGAITTHLGQLDSGLAAEISAREAADSALQSQLQSAISSAVGSASGSLSSDLSAETSARISADNILDGKITAEKNRAEAAEAQLLTDVNSSLVEAKNFATVKKAEAQSYAYAEVQTEKGRAETAEAGLQSSINQEISDRQSAVSSLQSSLTSSINGVSSSLSSEVSRAQGEESRIEGKLDSEISNRQSDVAAKLVEAKSYTDSVGAAKLAEGKTYTDGKISDLINGAPAMLDTLKEIADQLASDESAAVALTASLASEVSRAQAAEAQALVDANSYTDSKVLVEKNRAESAESTLTSNLNSEISNRQSAVSAVTSSLNSEISRAQAEEALMFKKDGSRPATGGFNMGGFGIGNLPTTGYPSVNGHASTKKYVDDQVSSEASLRSSGDASVTSAFEAADATITSNLNSEISRAQGAESALSTRVDVLEARAFNKMKIVIDTASELSYVDLDHTAVVNSMVVSVGRMMVHKTEDFTVSVVGGKTRLTWVGDFAVGGVEAIEDGDVIFVTYMY